MSGKPKGSAAVVAPKAHQALAISAQVQNQLLSLSPATIDRRLKPKKRQLKKRLYGGTKVGTLLKPMGEFLPLSVFADALTPEMSFHRNREQTRTN